MSDCSAIMNNGVKLGSPAVSKSMLCYHEV